MNQLLQLKTSYKNLTGSDWKPDLIDKVQKSSSVDQSSSSSQKTSDSGFSTEAIDLLTQIKSIGDQIRDLKAAKADKVRH